MDRTPLLGRRVAAVPPAQRCQLRMELLEDRTLLSTSYPLDPVQWTPLGPAPVQSGSNLSTGRVAALVAHPTDPNTIYAATAGGGVWKTTDGGTNWAPLTDNQETMYMGAIALAPSNPEVVYAGTGEASYGPSKIALRRENIFPGRGVLLSTDGGNTWVQEGRDLFYRRTISQIVVDPTDSSTVYLAVGAQAFTGLTGNTGVWKSTDAGATWNQVINGLPNFGDIDAVSDLAMDPADPQHLFAAVGTPAGSLANGVYQTFDGGASWVPAGNFPTGGSDTNLGRIVLAVSPSSPQIVFAAVAHSGANATLYHIYRTTDGGNTWTALANVPNYMGPYGDYNTSLAVDPTDPNVVFAGGQTSQIRTLNGGSTWTNVDFGLHSPHDDFHGIGFDAAGRLLDGTDGGMFRLENPTSSGNPVWTDLNGTLNTIQLTGIAMDPTNFDIVYGGAQDNFTEKFVDNLTWNYLRGGDGGFTRVDFTSPSTVYATYQYPQGSGFLARSTNGGASWLGRTSGINTSDPGDFYTPYVMDPSNASRLLLGTNRVYETVNRADNWAPISTPFANGWTVNDVVDSVAASGTDPDTIYATAGAHVFVTRNHGATWQETNPTAPNPDVRYRDIRVDANDTNVAYVVAASYGDATGGGHVWVTLDGGASWNDISGNLPDEPVWTVAIQPNPGQDILHVGADDGVYISYDLGTTWAREGQGMPNVQTHQLEVNTDLGILAAATYGRGLWELQLSSPQTAGSAGLLRLAIGALAEPSRQAGALAAVELPVVVAPVATPVAPGSAIAESGAVIPAAADADGHSVLARVQPQDTNTLGAGLGSDLYQPADPLSGNL